MNHAETVAKRVLEAILPGTMEYKPEQSHGEYDFELRYQDGATAAVEVTALVDQVQIETIASIRKKKSGSSILTAKCHKSWLIVPFKGARIDKIRANADDYLSRVEQAGIEAFYCVDERDQCVSDICRGLGVGFGSVIPTQSSPRIKIAFPAGGGAVDPSIAIDAGKEEARKEDNRKKLGAAKTAERHFVVYINAINGLPWVALTDFEPPSVLPNLPEEVTCIWLVDTGKKRMSLSSGMQEPKNLGGACALVSDLRSLGGNWHLGQSGVCHFLRFATSCSSFIAYPPKNSDGSSKEIQSSVILTGYSLCA